MVEDEKDRRSLREQAEDRLVFCASDLALFSRQQRENEKRPYGSMHCVYKKFYDYTRKQVSHEFKSKAKQLLMMVAMMGRFSGMTEKDMKDIVETASVRAQIDMTFTQKQDDEKPKSKAKKKKRMA